MIIVSRGCFFTTMKKIGPHYVPVLPSFSINPEATRQPREDEEQMSLEKYKLMTGYTSHHYSVPNCRYYAVQYRNRIYHVFNAYYYPMGRMINKIATHIRGKASPHYKNSVANTSIGDVCVIVNAMDPLFTGKKLKFKDLKYHTGFVGHLRTYSYRSILNRKPELLYFYLLRKAMPKTKISEEYMKNVKIYRGPTHDLKDLPQFAPKKKYESGIQNVQFDEYLKSIPTDDIKVAAESNNFSEQIFGKKLEKLNAQEKSDTLETDDILESEPKTKLHSALSEKERMKLERRRDLIAERYNYYRAPYKKKSQLNKGYEWFKDEKKARKSEHWDILSNEELDEVDEEEFEDPFLRKGYDIDSDEKK